MAGASIETTLEFWASSLRDVKARMRPLFTQERVAASAQYLLADIPLTFWIGVFFAILYWVMLRFTRIGQGMTAMGKNEPGAIFSAVRTRWLKVLVSRSWASRVA